jgi:hypothetical protein
VAIAVESPEREVRALAGELAAPLRFAIGGPDAARSFGDISAVPTLFVFDRAGRAAGTFYGAPPTLHADAEAAVTALLGAR